VLHISVRGDSPLFREVLDNPATVKAQYYSESDCPLDDVKSWHAANPGIAAGIKSEDYMQREVARVRNAPGDEGHFRAYDLNANLDPARAMILSVDELAACFSDDPPAREGPVALGFDFGESLSLTAASAIWPETGRLELWLACGDVPSLADRGRRDNAPYELMQKRGELVTYPGRVVPVAGFLGDVAADLGDSRVQWAAADGYKGKEALDYLDRAGLRWPVTFRRVGAGRDGGADVRAFQRLVHQRKLGLKRNLSLISAISQSRIRRDTNGNPGLDKARANGRIDVLSAAIIAAGLAAPEIGRPKPKFRFAICE